MDRLVPGRGPVPSCFLALAERLSGRQASSVRVNGMLVHMERVKMPLPDGPPPTALMSGISSSGQQQSAGGIVSLTGSGPVLMPFAVARNFMT